MYMQHELLNNQNKTFLQWEFDKENNWLYLNWIGYSSRENLIRGVEAVLKTLEEIRCPYLLNDNRELLGPWDQANDWMQTTMIPKATSFGLKYFAHVLSPGMAGALSAQDLHSRVDGSFNMQLFGEMEKAKTWLREKQKENGLA
jgi:hypothetical protein